MGNEWKDSVWLAVFQHSHAQKLSVMGWLDLLAVSAPYCPVSQSQNGLGCPGPCADIF